MTTTCTALDVLADRCTIANNAAHEKRAACEDWKAARHIDMKSYRQGEAVAYNDAHHIMKRELERLRNLWQNGGLSYDAFGLPS
jgi:hypothetical protein